MGGGEEEIDYKCEALKCFEESARILKKNLDQTANVEEGEEVKVLDDGKVVKTFSSKHGNDVFVTTNTYDNKEGNVYVFLL